MGESMLYHLDTFEGSVVVERFAAGETVFVENDWRVNPNGEAYKAGREGQAHGGGEGGPDLFRGLDDRVGRRISEVH